MSEQENLLSDIGTLMRIPNKVLTAITDKANLCISSIINEAKAEGKESVQINIGVGILSINLLDMLCKFTPSKNLKIAIKKGLENKEDPLQLELESIFVNKLLAVCNEVY